jgi:hypothetical protein
MAHVYRLARLAYGVFGDLQQELRLFEDSFLQSLMHLWVTLISAKKHRT